MKTHTILKWFKFADAAIAILGMAVLVALSLFGVIMRYFFLNPISWLEEMEVILVLWIAFLGASYAFRRKSHICIDFIVELFPLRVKNIVTTIVQFIVILVLGYIGVFGIRAIQHYSEMHNTTNILKIPYEIKYLAVPLGCALMIVSSTYQFIKDFKDEGKKEMEEM